jgi:hypothetical protein
VAGRANGLVTVRSQSGYVFRNPSGLFHFRIDPAGKAFPMVVMMLASGS